MNEEEKPKKRVPGLLKRVLDTFAGLTIVVAFSGCGRIDTGGNQHPDMIMHCLMRGITNCPLPVYNEPPESSVTTTSTPTLYPTGTPTQTPTPTPPPETATATPTPDAKATETAALCACADQFYNQDWAKNGATFLPPVIEFLNRLTQQDPTFFEVQDIQLVPDIDHSGECAATVLQHGADSGVRLTLSDSGYNVVCDAPNTAEFCP
jgi:hypothetical protein